MSTRLPNRKILVLAANPEGTSKLNLGVEVRGIQRSLQLAQERDRFSFVSEWAVRTQDLMQLLVTHQPHIVHFLGHGSGEKGLVLEDSGGRSQQVPTKALAKLFQQVSSVECVLLNACYSDVQAKAMSQFVPCVIGMNRPIGDPAAISFSQGFYTSLGSGGSYEAAYEMGRTAIELEGIAEGETPVLRTRAGKLAQGKGERGKGETDKREIKKGAKGKGPKGKGPKGKRVEGKENTGKESKGKEDAVKGKRVFISYRNQSPDKDLAQTFYEAFLAAGHHAFMAAESIQLGELWRERISTELRECDTFLLLLSSLSATSEMVTEEVKRAKAWGDERRERGEPRRPVILPVRVQFPLDDSLNYELRGYLQQIQQREWRSEADTAGLVAELLELMAVEESSEERTGAAPEAPTRKATVVVEPEPLMEEAAVDSVDRPPLPVAEPELKREPGGAVQLKSGLYVERPPIETDCFAEIEQPGALIRIKAPRQMGKTSLMARILSHAREQGYQTVPISFQRADSQLFDDLDLLLKWFCSQVGRRLKKLHELEDYWMGFGSKDKCNAYFEECLLEELEVPLVLALDEVDLVFPHGAVADDFFALVRSWYCSRGVS